MIGVIAPSSVVPRAELDLGVGRIRDAGFEVRVHPQCAQSHLFLAGADEARAKAFLEYAYDPALPVLWCARGGYGLARILPELDRRFRARKPPKGKLLIGYSDSTVLLDYMRARWGWATIHAEMPGLRKFLEIGAGEWEALTSWIRGQPAREPWGRLELVGKVPRAGIAAPLCGGNLTVWCSMLGTRFAPRAKGRIAFFEDVGEALYRVDRMVRQLLLAGALQGARAIVLGDFLDCKDSVVSVLSGEPGGAMKPLRERLDENRVIPEIFAEAAKELKIPLARGLPAGHGPGHAPLPLGARYRLASDGSFTLESWDWLEKT